VGEFAYCVYIGNFSLLSLQIEQQIGKTDITLAYERSFFWKIALTCITSKVFLYFAHQKTCSLATIKENKELNKNQNNVHHFWHIKWNFHKFPSENACILFRKLLTSFIINYINTFFACRTFTRITSNESPFVKFLLLYSWTVSTLILAKTLVWIKDHLL